jgi:creatinine amidohydrolase
MGIYSDSLENEVRLERMRPAQIDAARSALPAIYVPFGSVEWHGRHNPVGLDALKAHEQLVGLARGIGGVVYPPVFLGSGGGHLDYPYTYMMPAEIMVRATTLLLMGFQRDGFQKIVLLSGHYPNIREYLDPAVTDYRKQGGTADVLTVLENTIEGIGGDHAAKYETSSMMYLDQGLVDMAAISGPPQDVSEREERKNWMGSEHKDHPLYGLVGIDPRAYASARVGRENTQRLIAFIGNWVQQ